MSSPTVSVVDSSDAYTSFSQAGEDRILSFLFTSIGVTNPTYVDIGAHHPRRGNSTYLFYTMGCRGICVEPNPDYARLLEEERHGDIVIEAGVVPVMGPPLRYHMFKESTFNTFSKEEAATRTRNGGVGGELVKVVDVETLTLNELLLKYCPGGVDLLAIDVEGLDQEIIAECEFAIRPRIIMIETAPFSPKHPVRKHMQIIENLSSKKYHLVADTYINSIFVDEKFIG